MEKLTFLKSLIRCWQCCTAYDHCNDTILNTQTYLNKKLDSSMVAQRIYILCKLELLLNDMFDNML